jgi:V/A-type H+-transporting ATPase subunit E
MDRLDRIATIGSSILAQAENESRATIEKANSIRESELKTAEEKVIMEMGEYMQRETARIRHEAGSAVASERTGAKHSLLRRRDELSKLVFASVEKRLADYAGSGEYPGDLLGEIESVKTRYDHAASIVYLRGEDMGLADRVRALLPGCAVEASARIKLGGWQLKNAAASVLIDQSLDTRLRDQKDWYLEHCNLEVTK